MGPPAMDAAQRHSCAFQLESLCWRIAVAAAAADRSGRGAAAGDHPGDGHGGGVRPGWG